MTPDATHLVPSVEDVMALVRHLPAGEYRLLESAVTRLHAAAVHAERLAELLRGFARSEHRRRFPHVTATPDEVKADEALAAYERSLLAGSEGE